VFNISMFNDMGFKIMWDLNRWDYQHVFVFNIFDLNTWSRTYIKNQL
jgi:hypothetical protein